MLEDNNKYCVGKGIQKKHKKGPEMGSQLQMREDIRKSLIEEIVE
jgi:hypothetical protein